MATQPDIHPTFAGEFRHAIDDKNRITIPSAWRQKESDDFFLTVHPSRICLTVMPPSVFRAVGEKSEGLTPAERRIFARKFYSGARDLSTDKQGRLLLPEDFCKKVGLRGEAMLTGTLDRFEIWNPASWNKFHEDEHANYLRISERVGL